MLSSEAAQTIAKVVRSRDHRLIRKPVFQIVREEPRSLIPIIGRQCHCFETNRLKGTRDVSDDRPRVGKRARLQFGKYLDEVLFVEWRSSAEQVVKCSS